MQVCLQNPFLLIIFEKVLREINILYGTTLGTTKFIFYPAVAVNVTLNHNLFHIRVLIFKTVAFQFFHFL